MYNGIGLLTARGSGTSGHVQTNSFNIRTPGNQYFNTDDDVKKHARVRKADEKILEHERKRKIELKLHELTERLEENGYSKAEIQREVEEMRQQMQEEHEAMSEQQRVDELKAREDTHALAKRKEMEMNRFRDALGVSGGEQDSIRGDERVDGTDVPPEEPSKDARPTRLSKYEAEEKALEDQLLQEEEEILAREREKRVKRKEEIRQLKDEKRRRRN